jgi:hypothetical protein
MRTINVGYAVKYGPFYHGKNPDANQSLSFALRQADGGLGISSTKIPIWDINRITIVKMPQLRSSKHKWQWVHSVGRSQRPQVWSR